MVVQTCILCREALMGESYWDLISIIANTKSGRVAQVVEKLHSKHKTLSLTLQYHTEKNNTCKRLKRRTTRILILLISSCWVVTTCLYFIPDECVLSGLFSHFPWVVLLFTFFLYSVKGIDSTAKCVICKCSTNELIPTPLCLVTAPPLTIITWHSCLFQVLQLYLWLP
jgi:hypothetical protein